MQNSRVRNMMLRRREHAFVQESGFTLMELLIVLALIATISMIAIPLYSNYLQRAKITEGLTLAKGIQLEAELYYALNGDWPRENAHQALGLDKASDYRGNSVESIALEGNEITITYNDEVGAEGGPARLILRAEAPGGTIRWRCSGENIAEDHLPKECLP
ncbi:pilin [Ignatzschineria cameli]|nr:pilin [Ignatzschineria cameli]